MPYDNNNEGRDRFLQNRFQSPLIQPIKVKPKKKPAFIDQIFIGKKEKYYGRLQVYVHEPNLEFPDPTIILQLGSGNSSAFTRISTEDVNDIVEFFQRIQTNLTTVLSTLEDRSREARQTIDAYENIKRMKAIMLDPEPNQGEPDLSYDDEQMQQIEQFRNLYTGGGT